MKKLKLLTVIKKLIPACYLSRVFVYMVVSIDATLDRRDLIR